MFHKALLLVVLATSLRASQLHVLTRHVSWTTFTFGLSSVTLAPAQTHLFKNEREAFHLRPISVPAWKVGTNHHQWCPVWALHSYMVMTTTAPDAHLFVWPDSLKWCSTAHIATVLKQVIEAADQGKLPLAQEVRRMASTLHFHRNHSVTNVLAIGQRALSKSFAERYLALHIRDTPSVAMGATPGSKTLLENAGSDSFEGFSANCLPNP